MDDVIGRLSDALIWHTTRAVVAGHPELLGALLVLGVVLGVVRSRRRRVRR